MRRDEQREAPRRVGWRTGPAWVPLSGPERATFDRLHDSAMHALKVLQERFAGSGQR